MSRVSHRLLSLDFLLPSNLQPTHVPIFTDELGAQVKGLQSERIAMQASIQDLKNHRAECVC